MALFTSCNSTCSMRWLYDGMQCDWTERWCIRGVLSYCNDPGQYSERNSRILLTDGSLNISDKTRFLYPLYVTSKSSVPIVVSHRIPTKSVYHHHPKRAGAHKVYEAQEELEKRQPSQTRTRIAKWYIPISVPHSIPRTASTKHGFFSCKNCTWVFPSIKNIRRNTRQNQSARGPDRGRVS